MFKRLLAVAMIIAMIPFIVACKQQNTTDTNKENESAQTESAQTEDKNPSSDKEETPNNKDESGKNDKNSTDKDTPVSNKDPQGNTTENNPQNNQGDKEEPTPITKVPENIRNCTYEEYHAMTAETQKAFFEKFESVEAFFDWYKDAKAKYEKENAAIEIGGGEINLGDVMNGKK